MVDQFILIIDENFVGVHVGVYYLSSCLLLFSTKSSYSLNLVSKSFVRRDKVSFA